MFATRPYRQAWRLHAVATSVLQWVDSCRILSLFHSPLCGGIWWPDSAT